MALAAAVGTTVVVCGADPLRLRRSHLTGSAPLLVLCPDRTLISAGDIDLIREAVATDRTVVVALGDAAVADRALAEPSVDEPLVLDTHLRVRGLARLDGLVLEADDMVPLDACADSDLGAIEVHAASAATTPGRTTPPGSTQPGSTQPGSIVAGAIVAGAMRCGSGAVEVVGSVAFLNDHWISASDNAAILVELLAGPVGSTRAQRDQAAALVADHRPAVTRLHAEVPVIGTVAQDWTAMLETVPDLDPEDPRFVRAAGHARRLLPPAVHDALVDLGDDPTSIGALVLTGLPIGPLPRTPPSPTSAIDKDGTSEFLLLGLARSLGQPVGYRPEHGGTIVQNLLPTPGGAHLQTSTSSAVELEFHTETAFHPHRPRYLLLLCLRGDDRAQTLLCSVAEIVQQLPLSVRRVLREPRFRTGVDTSFTDGEPTVGSGERCDRPLGRAGPVLSGDPDHPMSTFDADLMHGIDDEATASLETFRRLAGDQRVEVTLRPGDALVVDNHTCIHGRSSFEARYDGTDRWLQRSLVVSDLSASAGSRRGRVITTRFV